MFYRLGKKFRKTLWEGGNLNYNPIKVTPSWLKFAALTRKRRKRLCNLKDFAYKLVLMRLPGSGSHVTSRNQGSFLKQEREP